MKVWDFSVKTSLSQSSGQKIGKFWSKQACLSHPDKILVKTSLPGHPDKIAGFFVFSHSPDENRQILDFAQQGSVGIFGGPLQARIQIVLYVPTMLPKENGNMCSTWRSQLTL